jgi:hypothetical protein
MNLDKVRNYWGILTLIVWGASIIALQLLRISPYGIDETAAHALLINWTVSDRVVNPIVVLGAPDLRALLFLPLGVYWAGSFLALKVFMLLIFFGATTLLYRWSREQWGDETAMLASGLLLISPLALMQIYAVGAGPFLLLGFALGAWLDRSYRAGGKPLSGGYFLQLLLIVTVVSIHPAGLAYPIALAWEWWRNPVDRRQQKHLWFGITLATLFVIVFRFGWPALNWGINPLFTLGDLVMGSVPGDLTPPHWAEGLLPASLFLCVLFYARKQILPSLFLRMLTFGIAIGLVAADHGWGLLVLAFILYVGTALLIRSNNALGANSFAGQRGFVMIALFAATTTFMLGDRAYRSSIVNESVDPHDEIIRTLVIQSEEVKDSFITSSQWPARTMLALKRPVFPLPPPAADPESLLQNLGKIDYIVFDPFDVRNAKLREQFAALSGPVETLVQQSRGAILKPRKQIAHPAFPSATQEPQGQPNADNPNNNK